MRFLIISHAGHKQDDTLLYSYAPYVREMNLWLKYVDKVEVVAPKLCDAPNAIEIPYQHKNIQFTKVSAIQFTSILYIFKSLILLPSILLTLFKACRKADHIHLRCPGNMGLLGCFVQVFFPNKIKTAKYAGNWDPQSKQPLSYRIQKSILSNTSITKNMSVLVYGDWKNQTKNIKSFFTATYTNAEIEAVTARNYTNTLKFVFIGSLVVGKRPLLAIQIIEGLKNKGFNVSLDLFGDGNLKQDLIDYIAESRLDNCITVHGNQTKNVVKQAIKTSHFSILPSKSEGWPKAIAEAMFFGCIPVVTKISCVPYMLDFGNRGILIDANLNQAVTVLAKAIKDNASLKLQSEKALKWSQHYTLDLFESEIANFLNH